MPAKTVKLDNDEAADIIMSEGLGYAVYDYCRGDSFEDPITHRLWDLAGAALGALADYLERETKREIN